MSKTIYYIELQSAGKQAAKFKFAIDNSKKVVKEVKQELKGKLVQKKALEDTQEIELRDKQLFELCSDDEIDDVVPEQEKNIIVTIKGEAKKEPSVVVGVPPVAPAPPVVGVSAPVAAPVVVAPAATKLSDCQLKPTKLVQPFEPEKHDEHHFQMKFTCPQLANPATEYGIVTPKKITFWELSVAIC